MIGPRDYILYLTLSTDLDFNASFTGDFSGCGRTAANEEDDEGGEEGAGRQEPQGARHVPHLREEHLLIRSGMID